MAEAVATADPARRATCETSAAAYGRGLDELDRSFADGLARCDRRVIVTSSAAFGPPRPPPRPHPRSHRGT
ncbi:MAG: metal ABC transporter solute-binding protein, Zn/Mn family [Acidimicrobiales bacterium]